MITKDRKVFFLYTFCIAVLIITGVSLNYGLNDKPGYFLLLRFYNILEYSLLSYFFSILIKNRIVKVILLFSPIVFCIFGIIDFINSNQPEIPFVPLAVEYVILLLFITYFFFEVMQNTTVEPVYQKAYFWISAAFIIAFSGNLLLFLYSKNSYNNVTFQKHYTIIYSSVTILKNILLCISAFIREKQEVSSSHPFDSNFDTFHPFKN